MISKSKKRRLRRQKMASLSPWKQELQQARKSLVTSAVKEAQWGKLRQSWGSAKTANVTAGMSLLKAIQIQEAKGVDR